MLLGTFFCFPPLAHISQELLLGGAHLADQRLVGGFFMARRWSLCDTTSCATLADLPAPALLQIRLADCLFGGEIRP
jgi:hypothetical protein